MSAIGSVESRGSSGSSRRSLNRQYRTINKVSTVDESLFGLPTKARQRQKSANDDVLLLTSRQELPNSTVKQRSNDPELIEIITKDMIRKLKVPEEDPSGKSVVLDRNDFNRIKSASYVLSKEEKLNVVEEAKKRKKELMNACEERKNFMQTMELNRKENEKLSDLEQEAKEKSQYLLEKATEQMEEQEDEIKKLNELILNAKCHAIRDAQLVEKVEVKKEMLDEETRLDEMMELERRKALQEYEEREKIRQIERIKGAQIIQKQIAENEQKRLLDEQKKDQETQAMLQYLEKLQQEDLDELMKKRETQKQLMEDVNKANEEMQRLRKLKNEQEKLADIKVMEYLKEKLAREEAFQEELEGQRIEREKEIARLRAQQEQAKDKQAEQNALRAKRNHEEAERNWRKKEREEALKKAESEKMLKEARERQVKDKEHFLAVQAARDRAEFERVLVAQQERLQRDEEIDKQSSIRRHRFAQDIREQISEKEKEKVHLRKTYFEEGEKLNKEAKERRQKLDEIKRRKLKELRDAGVPDKYCNEVARRVAAPPLY
ncbi:cilia- and flagella-associated protein 45-like [Xenia sp. Carnegie-2017]|uniref:cilia- and flagella-associated protein 45-like n=1 Tax=Xenia sp. Carnegie-2017 TaxID=2897299 RepID=UPI001F0478DC|nr:cilia- and flagella-associated protein 45-like [Xenia sp. Carnegie-2017]